MKKTLIIAAALAVAGLASCNRTAQDPEFTTYTLTVDASKDAIATRALELNGKALNAVWGDEDQVLVLNGTTKIGTLEPQSTGSASASLKGTITASGLSTGTKLMLITPSEKWKYTNQEGSLDLLSTDYDYATAEVTVTSVSGSDVVASAASFENKQAIIKFTLQNASGAALKVDELEISAAGGKLVREFKVSGGAYTPVYGNLSIVPSPASNVLYVAMRNENSGSDTYTLTATVGSDVYTCTKSGTFQNGKYYAGTVKMGAVEHTYTIAGSPESVFGSNWDPTDANNDMVKQSNGTYKKTYTLTAAKTDLSFKVALDHAWDMAWPSQNYTCSAGAGTLTITFNPSTYEVNATYPDPPAGYQDTYTVAGNLASVFGTVWDATNANNDMTLQGDGNFAITYKSVPSGSELEFKVVVNHSWSLNYGANGAPDGANVTHKMSATKDLTISFNPTTHIISAAEK